ncbi:MAG: hypothetical protein LBU11_07895 [Zoogloeaceae bacterium]|jgi:hypothetical protein|nr:hypothetical protein [Zoogloeaceae bacterium]
MNKIVMLLILAAVFVLAVLFLKPSAPATGVASAELNQELRQAALHDCDLKKVKELVKKGANINQTGDEGFDALLINRGRVGEFKDASLFSLVAIRTNGGMRKRCKETARYLSSMGAVDSGHYLGFCVRSNEYETPLVFENEHMKITFNRHSFLGTSRGVIEKKTVESIRIYSETSIINGTKRFRRWERTPNVEDEAMATAFIVVKDRPLRFSIPGQTMIGGHYHELPKVVDNKLKLVKEFALTYGYKGKTYKFELPEIIQEIDMDYKIMCGAPNVV